MHNLQNFNIKLFIVQSLWQILPNLKLHPNFFLIVQYTGNIWAGELLAKFSSPIFADKPKDTLKMHFIYYALTIAYLPNFSLPIAFTCTVRQNFPPPNISCVQFISKVAFSLSWTDIMCGQADTKSNDMNIRPHLRPGPVMLLSNVWKFSLILYISRSIDERYTVFHSLLRKHCWQDFKLADLFTVCKKPILVV